MQVVIERLVMSERMVFLARMQQLFELLTSLEELLLTSAPSAVIDVAARHDPLIAEMLLDLAEVNASVLDRVVALLEQSRDPLVVRDILDAMRAGAEAVGSLVTPPQEDEHG